MSKFGDRIRVLRIKRGLTQAQLAAAISKSMGIDLKRSAVGNYERGIREPDLDTIEAFADYFDTSIADIMGREEADLSQNGLAIIGDHLTAPFNTHEWINLTNCFRNMSKSEFEMWFNAIRANHPDFFDEGDDDDDPKP